MPPVPVISARECMAALSKVGFRVLRQKGSHITMKRDDPYARVTIPNHKELKIGMLRSIIRDAGLTVEEFMGLL